MGCYFLMINTIIGTMGQNECLWVSPQKLIDGKNILRYTSYYYIIILNKCGDHGKDLLDISNNCCRVGILPAFALIRVGILRAFALIRVGILPAFALIVGMKKGWGCDSTDN